MLVGYPFDTVKVTLQNAPPGQFSGPLQCSSNILNSKGVRGPLLRATFFMVGVFTIALTIVLRIPQPSSWLAFLQFSPVSLTCKLRSR